MLLNDLKMMIRHWRHHIGYSVINLFSLSLSYTVLIFIALFIMHELDHDRLNIHLDRMYTVLMDRQQSIISAGGLEIAENIPEILQFTRFFRRNDYALQYRPEGKQTEQSIMIKDLAFVWTDPDMFEIFTYDFIYGNPETALDQPYNIVLTDHIAQRLFGNEDPTGKVIRLNNQYELTVTAVVKKPNNSHLSFKVFASTLTLRNIGGLDADRNYEWNSYPTYVLLPEEVDLEAVNQKIDAHMKKVFERVGREPRTFSLFPAKDLYFSDIRYTGNHGNRMMIGILITVSLFIVIIAAINYINLSSARASTRAREIGIKKIVGVLRKNLIRQFLCESTFISLLALLFAFVLAFLFLPMLNQTLSTHVTGMYLLDLRFLGFLLITICLIGMISGIYPALYLTSFVPLRVIKGEITGGQKAASFRRLMIVFQFTISIILIIGIFTVYNQIRFVMDKDLGFDGKNVMTFAGPRFRQFQDNIESVKMELLKHPDILRISISHGYPGRPENNESLKIKDKYVGFTHYSADSEFFHVYKLELLRGRFIDTERSMDRLRAIVLNETAVREFGLENPVGKRLPHEIRGLTALPVEELEVVGVIKDFHCRPLHRRINPVVISYNDEWFSQGSILLSGENLSETLRYIQGIWSRYAPGFPFEYVFVDEDFKAMYKKDVVFEKIFFYAAGFSILITCIGLLGLVSYVAEKRSKEIGIRKVLGAPLSSILFLLSHEFSSAVFLANLLAWPIAYFAMNKWLQNFVYRFSLNVWIFIFSGLSALFIALLTVSYQTIKAATANPVDSLRYE